MLAACGIGRLSHFLRNAPEYLPRRVDCLQELGWLCDRRDLPEAHRDLAAWLTKWAAKYPKLHRLGRSEHRPNADVLPAAASAPEASQIDQHADASQRGDQRPNSCRAHFPQWRELLEAGCARSPSKPTRTGWSSIGISTSLLGSAPGETPTQASSPIVQCKHAHFSLRASLIGPASHRLKRGLSDPRCVISRTARDRPETGKSTDRCPASGQIPVRRTT